MHWKTVEKSLSGGLQICNYLGCLDTGGPSLLLAVSLCAELSGCRPAAKADAGITSVSAKLLHKANY